MSYIYNNKLNASPFVIAPDGYSNQEASVIVGSQLLAENLSKFIQIWHNKADKFCCPIVAHLIPLKDETMIAVTIKTTALDSHSNRKGLRLTCGVILHNSLFVFSSSVCVQSLKIIEEYLQTFSPNPFSISGGSAIADYFQGQKTIEEKINESDIGILIEKFESEFCMTDKPFVNILDRFGYMAKYYRQLKCQRVKPLIDRKGIMKFWHEVDNDICQNQKNYSKIEIETEDGVIKLQISPPNLN